MEGFISIAAKSVEGFISILVVSILVISGWLFYYKEVCEIPARYNDFLYYSTFGSTNLENVDVVGKLVVNFGASS